MKAAGAALAAVLVLVTGLTALFAQAPGRRPTTIDALRRYPGYYHLQNVLLRGEFADSAPPVQLRADGSDIAVLLDEGVRTTGGPVEVRAQLLDVGRLEPGDPRLATYAGTRENDRWPRPGEELLIKVTSVMPAEPPGTPTVRSLALEPWRYEGQSVTLVGQFRGRNLFGDLPGAPAKSRYDFVLRSGDGAVWVTGLRPRGRGFDLNVDARVDTSQWLEVTGTVRRERSLVTIEGARVAAAAPRTEVPVDEEATPPPPPAPVEVVFSTPGPGDEDVPAAGSVRIQFSKGLDPDTVASGFAVSYSAADIAPPAFRTTYDVATRSVEIRFEQPLAAFSLVRIDTRDSLKGFDGAPVTPWSMTFSAGR